MTAIKCMHQSITIDEKNERVKESVRKKFTEYLDRAEKLKVLITQLNDRNTFKRQLQTLRITRKGQSHRTESRLEMMAMHPRKKATETRRRTPSPRK
jgi:hypothetical protein